MILYRAKTSTELSNESRLHFLESFSLLFLLFFFLFITPLLALTHFLILSFFVFRFSCFTCLF